jgi:hypothetical protein
LNGGSWWNNGSKYYPGFAGDGTGGKVNDYNQTAYGWSANANNNAYSIYTVSSNSPNVPGSSGLAGGYGAGGAGVYGKNVATVKGGYGGNGTVIIWWDSALYS